MHEHAGHRQRMIKKIQMGVLLEHEQLEVLLYNALPRRNTCDLAHRLLAEFGSIKNVLHASYEALKKVEGVGDSVASYLYVLGQLNMPQRQNLIWGYRWKYNANEFCDYVQKAYAKENVEVIDAYFLDGDSVMYAKHRFERGNARSVSLFTEEFCQVLSEVRPSGIVLVHNHPAGFCKASKSDDESTSKCQIICNMQNVLLCDHVVCGQDGAYSYYLSGRMKEVSKKFAIDRLIKQNEGEDDEKGC